MPQVRLPSGQIVNMSDAEYRAYQQRQGGGSGSGFDAQNTAATAVASAGVKEGVKQGGTAIGDAFGWNTPSTTAPALESAASSASLAGGESAMPAGWSTYEGISSSLAPQAGAQAGTGWGSTVAAAAPWLGLAGMTYAWGDQAKGAYDQLSNDTTSDDAAGSIKAGLLTNPLTFWAAPFVDMAGIKVGKHKDQRGRDASRRNLREFGILDDDYGFTMADGSSFNLGSERLRDASGEVIKGLAPNDKSYNIDWDTADNDLVGALQPLAFLVTNGDEKRQADLVGQFYNMAKTSEDPYAVVEQLYSKFQEQGLGRDQIAQLITERAAEKEIDAGVRDALISGVDVNTRNQIGQENSPKGRYKPGVAAATPLTPGDRNGGRPVPGNPGYNTETKPKGSGNAPASSYSPSVPGAGKPQAIQPKSSSGNYSFGRATPKDRIQGRPAAAATQPRKAENKGRPSPYEKKSNAARDRRRNAD